MEKVKDVLKKVISLGGWVIAILEAIVTNLN